MHPPAYRTVLGCSCCHKKKDRALRQELSGKTYPHCPASNSFYSLPTAFLALAEARGLAVSCKRVQARLLPFLNHLFPSHPTPLTLDETS